MTDQEHIQYIALTQIPGLGAVRAKRLIQLVGSVADIFLNRKELSQLFPEINKRLVDLLDCPSSLLRAEKEWEFILKNKITCISLQDENYPFRLRECDDAPIVLYAKGEMNLNVRRVVSVVGTRNITAYGEQLCEQLIKDLQLLCPDILIVSGLAYGVDIHTHRAALANHLPTVGVLAHGLDRVYPSAHRKTAVEMLANGGLLTEYLSQTNPDRMNFVQRNRIVAGMSDATIVVESAAKGGALITAELAQSYDRECFTFPGRVGDELSLGCNRLVRDNKASLILSAEDFINSMRWEATDDEQKVTGVQLNLFVDLSSDEQVVVDLLRIEGNQQINELIIKTNLPINQLYAILFDLEEKGVVRMLVGGNYQLI